MGWAGLNRPRRPVSCPSRAESRGRTPDAWRGDGFGNGKITGQIELGFFPRLPETLRIAQATSALLQGPLSAPLSAPRAA
jgi:hypothetical protein